MKRSVKIFLIFFSTVLLAACNNTIERTDRTVTLIQENVTSIVNELTEIQLIENNLQGEFEATLNSSDSLEVFAQEDTSIMSNINARSEHLDLLEEQRQQLNDLAAEFDNQISSSPLPEQEMLNQIALLNELSEALSIYLTDYKQNLETERVIYQSIANPETNYESFFAVFNRVSVLHTTNNINLENALGYFEPINAQLVNFKVYLANLKESN